MTAQEVNFSNFFETTLNGTLASSAFNAGTGSQQLTNAPTSNGTDAIAAKFYLVIDPDNTNREVVLVNTISGTEITAMTRDVENRHGLTKPEHTSGTVVRMAVVKEMFEDIHDRIDAGVTASSTTVLTNKTISSASNTLTVDADNATVSNLEVDNLKAATLVTDSEGIGSNDNNTTLPTSAAVKDYVDTQVATKASVGLVLALGG